MGYPIWLRPNTTTGLIDGFLWEGKPSVSQRLDVGATAGLTATGPNADQDLRLSPQGSGLVRIDNPSNAAAAPRNFSATRMVTIKLAGGATVYVPASTATSVAAR